MRCALALLAILTVAFAPPPGRAQPAGDGIEATADASTSDRNNRNALRVKVRTEALRAGLPAEIADAVATVESGYDFRAIGRVGEIGLMQVLPSTARLLGFEGTLAELAAPDTNIRYGVAYLAGAWRLAETDLCRTVMKYRAGHAEERYSYRSVDYCRRVRAVLAAQGYPLFGEVPVATFGEPVVGGSVIGVRLTGKRVTAGRGKSRINWAAADARMRAITSKISMASLAISR
jgi:soluble lytic murein transglycosylase-like protein